SIYEAGEFLGAPPGEQVPEQEVALWRRFANVRTIGSIVFAVVLLFFLFRYVFGVDFGRTWERIAQADPALLVAALLAYYATFPLRGLRWHFVLRRSGADVPLPAATEILFLSWFVNCVVPAKLGDLYRAYLLRANFGASVSRTVGTIFVERIADIVVIFVLALAAGYWSFRGRERPEVDALFLAGFAFAALLCILLLSLRMFGTAIGRRLPARVAQVYDRFREGTVGALTPRSLTIVAGLTGLIWMGEALRVFFVVRALELPDVGLGISAAAFVALAGSLLTAIPLTPAGVGFVEAGIVAALALYGVDSQSSGAAVAFTDRAISVLSVLVMGGALYATSGKIRRAHGMAPRPRPTVG
ncbi:MAG: flippase-like domain-containing protein, partial [Chloroflexota bacterium]|nr:flippase-like domain-containing protein [Chloroflexota bacterium]